MVVEKVEDFRNVPLTEYDMVVIKQCLEMAVYNADKMRPDSIEHAKMLLDFFEAELK